MINKDDEERIRNFILFKMYVTDKEMEEIAPFMCAFILIALLFVGIFVFVGMIFS